MTISGPNAQALTPVLQGAKAAVFGAVDYVSYASVEKGESVKVIFPAGGTAIAPRPMMILKTARQPDEARKFVDYVLSEEGQRAVADAWLMPARQDVAAKRLFRTGVAARGPGRVQRVARRGPRPLRPHLWPIGVVPRSATRFPRARLRPGKPAPRRPA